MVLAKLVIWKRSESLTQRWHSTVSNAGNAGSGILSYFKGPTAAKLHEFRMCNAGRLCRINSVLRPMVLRGSAKRTRLCPR